MSVGLSLFIYLLLLMFACDTCLRASLVYIAVGAIADDSPISDETSPVAEGSVKHCDCHVCVQCVNVFIVVEELWEGFETSFSTYLA